MPRENETPKVFDIRTIPFNLGLFNWSEISDKVSLNETEYVLTPFSEAKSSISFTESCLFLALNMSSNLCLKSLSNVKTSLILDFSIAES